MKRLPWSHDLGRIGDTTFVQPMVLALPSFFRYLFGAWNVRSDFFRFSSFGVHDGLDQAMDSRSAGTTAMAGIHYGRRIPKLELRMKSALLLHGKGCRGL